MTGGIPGGRGGKPEGSGGRDIDEGSGGSPGGSGGRSIAFLGTDCIGISINFVVPIGTEPGGRGILCICSVVASFANMGVGKLLRFGITELKGAI